MKRIKSLKKFLGALVILASGKIYALDDPFETGEAWKTKAGFKWSNLWTEIPDLIGIILAVMGVIIVVFLILGGVQYATAGGNDEQQKKAKKTITNSIVGLIIVLLAYAIAQGVKTIITG